MDARSQHNKDEDGQKQGRPCDGQPLWEQAWSAYLSGQLATAESACAQLLRIQPWHVPGQCLLAEIYRNTGRPDDAIRQLEQAIRVAPEEAQPRYSLGLIRLNQGDANKAVDCFREAVRLRPDFAEAHASLGSACYRSGLLNEAVEAYRAAIGLKPDLLEAYRNLGVALIGLGRYREAAEQYRSMLSLRPDHADAHHGLGLCLEWLEDLEGAAASYEQGLRSDPAHVGMWNNIGSVYLAQNRRREALVAFRRSADLKYNQGRPIAAPLQMYLHRIRHDCEQLQYLDRTLGIPETQRDCLDALSELVAAHAGKAGAEKVTVDARAVNRIAPMLNRILHYAECPEFPGGALNPDVDWSAVERAYAGSAPEMVTVDGFLRPRALESLWRYCLGSTVWKTVRPYGYLGALIADGFASPLLLQIAAELREKLPGILSGHRLAQAWAYKYDSRLRAINIHADCAAVNINFWITPDAANLNPESGGMVVWDKMPPPDWGLMRTQNPDKTEIVRFLEESGARAITVPYRRNRMVIFNSALFHKSDDMQFKEGYENRRINVTLLYGYGLS